MSFAINVEHVSKSFGKKRVLDDVSLQVPKGVVFALLGENGAGKSTLIRGMLGYHRFNSGSIRVCEFDPQRQPLDLSWFNKNWNSRKPDLAIGERFEP